MEAKGTNLVDVKKNNQSLIRTLIFQKDITRTDISKVLGLTLPTVTTFVGNMIDQGYVEETDYYNRNVERSFGRKAKGLKYRGDAAYFIGAELGPYSTTIVQVNLNGETIACYDGPSFHGSYEDMLKSLTTSILKFVSPCREKICGLAIGIPGYIDRNTGTIGENPREAWIGHKLSEDIEKITQIPAAVDNNVRIRASSYALRSADETFMYYFVSRGIACPVVINREIVSASESGAGELGRTILMIGNGHSYSYKTVDDLASERALEQACNNYLNQSKNDESSFIHTSLEKIVVMKSQDKAIESICNQVIVYNSYALSNIINLFNTGNIIVDGRMFQSEEAQKLLTKEVPKKVFGLDKKSLNIHFIPYDIYGGAKAAALFAIKTFFLNG